MCPRHQWPIFIQDKDGRVIYLTRERWEHALDHPGMSDALLDVVLDVIRTGRRKQDRYDPYKYRYSKSVPGLPFDYTHVVVWVKFGWTRSEPVRENNFVLTAYLTREGVR